LRRIEVRIVPGTCVPRIKPAGVIGISVGAIGTAVSQQHLRTILAYLDAPT
jgi:NAD(P)H-dependent FMN reductase